MELDLDILDIATDLFVLDGIVAARINDQEFRFFPKPLVLSDSVEPLLLVNNDLTSDEDADV